MDETQGDAPHLGGGSVHPETVRIGLRGTCMATTLR